LSPKNDFHGSFANNAVVSLDGSGERKTDSSIARRRFDDRVAGLELAIAFCLLHNSNRDAIFDAAAGVEVLAFRVCSRMNDVG